MVTPVLVGVGAGLVIFGVLCWAFARGCPIFDVEHDTVLGF